MNSSQPSHPPSTPNSRSRVPDVDLSSLANAGDDSSAAPFEWSDFLDFNFDEQLFLSLEDSSRSQQEAIPELPPPPLQAAGDVVDSSSDRVRKRDPRLVCSNFLAGRVPCACPELDAKMEEEAEKEQGGPWKKRVRVGRGSKARCQVPECEADISELKGYHRRHRVCLQCANAKEVIAASKRSCRRKLERHNNRRRRKAVDSRGCADKEPQLDLQGEDVSSDGEDGKGNISFSTHNAEGDGSQGPEDGNRSNSYSTPDCQIIQSDSAATFTASGETQFDGGKDDSNYDIPPIFDNKSAYSSACPTGRISFKLYDWNPAEFPRRLRLQIFQWLANMPVELEGYIRPGCIILTAYISMPVSKWMKLLDDPATYVQDFLSPGRVLSRKGTKLVYLNNMILRVLRDGTSVIKGKVAKRAPKLHYVYPSVFEAGKPLEFIVSGSNIYQPNFRSLVSFAGKYLDHTYYVAFPHDRHDGGASSASYDHQLCRILVPHTEADIHGPAFIEVENEFGLSNFIPIIIGDGELCSEMKLMQQKHDVSCGNDLHSESDDSLHGTCPSSSRQSAFSDFLLDVAWLLKQPIAEKLQHAVTSSQIKRITCLLNYLIRNQSVYVLGRILDSIAAIVDDVAKNNSIEISDADRRFLHEHVAQAQDFLSQNLRIKKNRSSWHKIKPLPKGNLLSHALPRSDTVSIVPNEVQDVRIRAEGTECSTSALEETIPLLNGEVAMDVVDTKQQWRKSCNPVMTNHIIKPRPSILIMAAFAICFAVCTVLLHPSPVHKIAVSIRRCMFDDTL
ncbi:hypothetical protein V2J09_013422 [Rumex salicifolius]